MESLGRSLERLGSVLEGDGPLVGELYDLLDTLRASGASGGGVGHGQSQDIAACFASSSGQGGGGGGGGLLQQSLRETERRCEALRQDMVVQADANEELVKALESAKEANRRLYDQLQSQAESLTRLSQQRAKDEDRIDSFIDSHRSEQLEGLQQAERTLAALREDASGRQGRVQGQWAAKSQKVRTKLKSVQENFRMLKRQHQELRNLAEQPQHFMQAIEEELMREVEGYCKQQAESKFAVEPEAQELGTALRGEIERRREDSTAWAQQHAALSACNGDLQAQAERDMRCLSVQLSGLEHALAAEQDHGAVERARAEAEVEQRMAEQGEQEAALERLSRDLRRLEAVDGASSAALREREWALRDVTRQLRESSDALAAATLSKQHLGHQLQDLGLRRDGERESAVSVCRSGFERRLVLARAEHEGDMQMKARLVGAVRDAVAARTDEFSKLKAQSEDLRVEGLTLQSELNESRASFSSAVAWRGRLEDELTECRKAFGRERLQLQSVIEELISTNGASVADLQDVAQRCVELRRAVQDEELQQSGFESARADLLKDVTAQLAERKSRLAESHEALQRERRQVHAEEQAANGKRDGWCEDLQREHQFLSHEVRQFEEQVAVHARALSKGRTLLEQRRASQSASLVQMREDCQAKASVLERQLGLAKDQLASEVSLARRETAQQEERIASLERDLPRLQEMIASRQSQLAVVRGECRQEEGEIERMRGRLQSELALTSERLDQALASATSPPSPPGASAGAGAGGGGQRVAREIARLRERCGLLRAEADTRLQQAKDEHEASLADVRARHREALGRCRARFDALSKERVELLSPKAASPSFGRPTASLARSASLALLGM